MPCSDIGLDPYTRFGLLATVIVFTLCALASFLASRGDQAEPFVVRASIRGGLVLFSGIAIAAGVVLVRWG